MIVYFFLLSSSQSTQHYHSDLALNINQNEEREVQTQQKRVDFTNERNTQELKYDASDFWNYLTMDLSQTRQDMNISKMKRYELWETTTVLRSALYRYVVENNKVPQDLLRLTDPFPNNFLSALPKEPVKYSNQVTSKLSNNGGWIYKPQEINMGSEKDLKDSIQNAISPNLKITQELIIPFEPIEIKISKNSNKLYVKSGKYVISTYTVTLGENGKTPTGSFEIQKKVMNPNKQITNLQSNPYGTRALELSNPTYAIHGTNEPSKIGFNISNGCIRMLNDSITDLYAKVSLFTPVNIISDHNPSMKDETFVKSLSFMKNKSVHKNPQSLYDKSDNDREENLGHVYRWAK